ncbi:MAG: IgA Peptidase M64 [Acidobacteria bacterium]|nr:IgA Peptidase M64 [Acidobacteriota bacterium]
MRILLVALLAAAAAPPPAPPFDTVFTDRTMRVDYFHTGDIDEEIVAVDRVVDDGAWPGSRTRLVDETNLGKYLYAVIDRATNRPIYSRGFASVYGEWETTPEAREVHRTFHESLRFPWPKAPVQLVLKKRARDGTFREIWSTAIDPGSRFVNRAAPPPAGHVTPLFEHGPAAQKVDLLVLGDGYTRSEMQKFRADAERLVTALFAVEPFRSRRQDFNVRLLEIPSAESGGHRARADVHRRTPLSADFNAFDSERYILTFDNRTLRDAASSAPYDFLEVLVNDRQYGGGGIYNFQATASVDSAYSEYVFIHEFAHHFAALADEYYTSDVAYETGAPARPEPWEPNVTALHDPARLKWRDLVTPGTPVPTPWDKAEYEKKSLAIQARRRELRQKNAPESEMDRLFREQQAWEEPFLASMTYSGAVGAFEGASYEAKGLYRPQADCIMFTRNPVGFCRVCARSIGRIIDEYARP